MNTKIKTKIEIAKIVNGLRKNNPKIKIVTTNGAFDILHSGHVKSLAVAKSYGDILIVGLNSDSSVQKYKSENRPIISQNDRAELLAALEVVNYVVIFDETNPNKLLETIKPTFHIKSKTGYLGIEGPTVESNGGKIILIEDFLGISTTKIIDKIIKVAKLEKKF